MAKYTKLKITANTLVEHGAVQESAIYKEVDGKIKTITKSLEIRKNDSKMEIESVLYMLNKVDAHGDWVEDPKVLDEAALDFMQNGSKIVKHTHSGKEIEAYIKELYLVPKGHPIWKEDKFIGALVNVIKFKDVELYNFYKDNNYETSIEGFVEVEGDEKVEKSNMFKKMYELIISKLKSEGSIIMKKEDVKESEVKKEPDTTDTKVEVKPEDVKESEVKKELTQEVIDYVTGIVNELTAKYDAKYDELKGMISNLVPNTEIESVKEVLKEIKKDITLGRENSTTDVKPKKTSLLS